MFARVMAPRRLPELQKLIDAHEPDLVLQAPVDLAAPLAAASRGVPTLTYGTGLVLEQPLMSKMAEWVQPLWAEHGLEAYENSGMYRDSYLNPVPATLQPEPVDVAPDPMKPADTAVAVQWMLQGLEPR